MGTKPWGCRAKVCWPHGTIPVLPSLNYGEKNLWMSEKAADITSKHRTMKSSSQLKITSKGACPRESKFTSCPQAESLQRWGDVTLSTAQTAPPNTPPLQGIYTTRRVLLTQDLSPHSVQAWKANKWMCKVSVKLATQCKPILKQQSAAVPDGKHTTTLFFFFLSFSMLEKGNGSLLAWYLVPEPLASANAACKIPLTDDYRGSHKLYRAYHNHRTQHHPKSNSLSPDTCKWNQLQIYHCEVMALWEMK